MNRSLLAALFLPFPLVAAPVFTVGGNVRLTRGESLLFQGKERDPHLYLVLVNITLAAGLLLVIADSL